MKRLQTTLILLLFSIIFTSMASGAAIHIYSQFDLFKSNHARQTDLSVGWQVRKAQNGPWEKYEETQPLPLNEQFEFRKIFALDSNSVGTKYQLEINGLTGACAVYLNGKVLGTHHGGAPASFQVPGTLLSFQNANEISIQMSTRFDYKSSIPLRYRARGIPILARPFLPKVTLRVLPEYFVSSAHLTPSANDKNAFQFNVRISHPPLKIKVTSRWQRRYLRIQVIDKEKLTPVWNSKILRPVREAEGETDFQVDIPESRIRLWRVGSPQNYTLKITFGSRGQSEEISAFSFAMRTHPENSFFSMQADSVQKMKCIEWIADKKYAFKTDKGKREQIKSDLTLIKELHANTVRVFASAPKPFFLDMCDSLGLGVLVEIPLRNAPAKILERNDVREKAGELFQNYIRTFQNHPSVIAWGVGSGYIGSDLRTQEFVGNLKQIAAKWDDRPVYAGVLATKMPSQGMNIDFQILETIIDEPEDLADTFSHLTTSGKSIIGISVPIALQKGNLQAAEREQASIFRETLGKIMGNKTADGVTISPLRDFYGETPHLRWGPRRGANIFPAGLLDTGNKTRPAFNVVKAIFADSETADRSFVRQPSETILFEIIGFVVLLLFLMVVRSDRVFRNYLRRIFLFPHGFYMDMSENRRVSSFLTTLIGTTCIVTLSLLLASYVYFLRFSSAFDDILTWYFANPQFKYKVIWLIWHPFLLILFFALLFFSLILLQSLIFKIITFFQHRYVKWTQLLTFVLWVPASLLFAAPIVIVLYRLLERSTFVQPASILLFVIFLWTILRIFRGTKVILQLTNFQTFVLYIFVLGIITAGFGGYLEYHRSLLAYAGYFVSLLGF